MSNPSKAMLIEAGAELFSNAPRFVSLVLGAFFEARRGSKNEAGSIFPVVLQRMYSAGSEGCKAAAEGAYTAALLRCVDQAETLERSQACRKSVDEQYGVKR